MNSLIPNKYRNVSNMENASKIEKCFLKRKFKVDAKKKLNKISDISIFNLERDIETILESDILKVTEEDSVAVEYGIDVINKESIKKLIDDLYFNKIIYDFYIFEFLINIFPNYIGEKNTKKLNEIRLLFSRIDKMVKKIYTGKGMKKDYTLLKTSVRRNVQFVNTYYNYLIN